MTARGLLLLVVLVCGVFGLGEMNVTLFDTNTGAVCNDGSPAGFYWRAGSGSGASKFVIHLQGGAWCNDKASCAYRWESSPDLMSSKGWDSSIIMTEGLFSLDERKNAWYNANEFFVMYCSSDVWSGNSTSDSNQLWQFKGKQIIKTLIDEMWTNFGLDTATEVLFSGCSAGGQGVIVNADYVSELLKAKGSTALYKSFADAGWLQNLVPYFKNESSQAYQMESGYPMWNGQLSPNCALSNPGLEWLCYFTPFAYPHIRTPIFIQTEQFDTYQVTSNSGYPPYDSSEWEYVQSVRHAFDASLQIVQQQNSFFSAACFHHCSSEDNSFNTILINGYSLSTVLANWYYTLQPPYRLMDTCAGFNCSTGCPPDPY